MPLPWLKQLDLPDGAYLVGGCVRDFLLTGEMGEDIDIVLEGDAGELAKSLFEKGVATAPPEIYSRFGTAMVRVAGRHVEIASARSESYSEDSRKPNTEMATLKEDMVRRDFTVNALMMDADTQEVVDLLGRGLSDLENRILRTPADPDVSFSDDPLRTLRAVRFKHRLGFEYGEGIEDALTRNAKRLEIISAERIRDELLKMLRLPTAHEAIEDLRRFGLLEQFWPELCALHGVEQGFRHRLDAWGHTLEVLRLVGPGDLTLSLAALLHDIAKPQTRKVDEDGRTRFFGHTEQGAPIAKLMINRLRIGQDVAADTALLVQNHMRLGPKEQIKIGLCAAWSKIWVISSTGSSA